MVSESSMERFDSEVKNISTLYSVTKEQAACYLCNFDCYICNEFNGGCKNIEKCRDIREKMLKK